MLIGCIRRFVHTNAVYYNSQKSLLATLRKKTGYTFTNCKKALELHNNNLQEAEKWLHQQAQALGWSKAAKLENRKTNQGLIGVLVNGKNAALVEVNCETDFVARNHIFQGMVGDITKACLQYVENQAESGVPLSKIALNSDQLKGLELNGKPLGDLVALTIGFVGENATLKRAICMKSRDDIHLSAYAHPSGNQADDVLLGRVAGVVALRATNEIDCNLEEIGRNLCLHVVGMDPKKIGTDDDEPVQNKDLEECLIHQEYVMDNSVTVKEILMENGVEVMDYQRMECGVVEDKEKEVDDETPLISVGSV